MVKIFIIFLIVILLLAGAIGIAVMMRSKKFPEDIDCQYYDEDGNHVYYDRRRIEKKEFMRNNPDAKPRSFGRLFSKKTDREKR